MRFSAHFCSNLLLKILKKNTFKTKKKNAKSSKSSTFLNKILIYNRIVSFRWNAIRFPIKCRDDIFCYKIIVFPVDRLEGAGIWDKVISISNIQYSNSHICFKFIAKINDDKIKIDDKTMCYCKHKTTSNSVFALKVNDI